MGINAVKRKMGGEEKTKPPAPVYLLPARNPFFRPINFSGTSIREMSFYDNTFVPRYSDCYAIRISYGNDRLPFQFWMGLQNLAEGVFATEHDDTERKHIHLALYNSRYTHDRLRKKLVELIKTTVEDNPPTGNALMSVKKWDGSDIYLVYMLKGLRYGIVSNYLGMDRPQTFLRLDYIDELKRKWVENMSKAAGYYNEFKTSMFWVPPVAPWTREQHMESTTQPPKTDFETIRKAAILFSLAYLKVTAVDAKVRFIAKDIISNYCLFNDIAMRPIYI